jgi:DNA repair protein RadA/Sms
VQLEAIVGAIRTLQPEVVVIDSIQTVYTEALESAPGSVAQVRECAAQLTRLAKQSAITVILVGHVTKEGAIAGPRVLEHIVDTVLYFEGDAHSSFRLVRAIKNRFGAAQAIVFGMTERGLKASRIRRPCSSRSTAKPSRARPPRERAGLRE